MARSFRRLFALPSHPDHVVMALDDVGGRTMVVDWLVFAGLMLFAAGSAGTWFAAPGVGFLLLLSALPVFVRMFRQRAFQGEDGAKWLAATVVYAIAMLIALSPMLFTATFATVWVLCAAAATNFGLSALPTDGDSARLVVSVTMALVGLGLLLRRTLLAGHGTREIEPS